MLGCFNSPAIISLLKCHVMFPELNAQIVLLDEDAQVLCSRHLKSGESVESGKKCHFPNYLVDICEAKNQNKGNFINALV